MSGRRLSVALFAVGALALVVLAVRASGSMPDFGETPHPYGGRAVAAALHQTTANAVMSVTLDLRGFDTLGEELILFTAAIGTLLLLRRMREEDEEEGPGSHSFGPEDVFDSLRLAGYVLLPVVLLVGGYIVLHGHVSPGGGFQGGVVLATGLHLAYLAGDLPILQRLRPEPAFDVSEALGAAAYLVVGLTAFAAGSAFLTNWLPHGRLGDLMSGGTVPVLNIAIGVEVCSALVLVLAKFLEQALLIHDPGED